jgi:hypothetical protein
VLGRSKFHHLTEPNFLEIYSYHDYCFF